MELYEMMKNIYGLDIEEELIEAISLTRIQLKGLTEERMCMVYSSHLLAELQKRHISARLISTTDLGLGYDHHFILIPSDDANYFLSDLTFSQFNQNQEEFSKLLKRGYQSIDDDNFNRYLRIITNGNIDNTISIENAFYGIENNKMHR